jgi:predicted alpha-1,2-mannosidase
MTKQFYLKIRQLSAPPIYLGALLCGVGVTQAQISWTGSSGDYNTAENWDSGAIPDASEAISIASGVATSSENLTRDASTSLSGTGELVVSGRFINAANASSELNISDDATLTQDGQYFLVANGSAGSIIQTGGTINSTVSSGWFMSDNSGSSASYTLTGGSLNVSSSAGNGVHFGKNSSADTFLVDGGNANFSASTSNMRVYFSKGSTFQLDTGDVSFDSFQYLVIGREYEADSTTKVIINGGAMTINELQDGGAVAMANKNDSLITINDGSLSIDGDLWIGDADASVDTVPTASIVQNGGTVTITGEMILARSSGGAGSYTMNGGSLELESITIGSGSEPAFNFLGGQLVLTGDQSYLAEEDWFTVDPDTTVVYDLETDATTFTADTSGAVLRHHYLLDANAEDSLGVANLSEEGDGISYSATGGAANGYVSLDGSDDYLLADLDTGSNFSALGDYSTFKPFSMSFWVRQTIEQAASSTQSIFGMTTDTTDSSYYNTGFEVITRESSAGLGLTVRARNAGGGSDEGQLSTGTSVSNGSWHHIVVTFDEDERNAYIDGIWMGKSTVSIPITTNPISNFAIGAFIRAGSILDDLPADVDDFQVYDGILTATEAIQLYENPGQTLNDDLPDASTTDGYPDPAETDPVDLIDTMIGVTGNGSCIPGVTLPHGSIYASPDSESAVASGYLSGSPVVGFSQLHAQGAGSSTLSYGNFLVSPRIGAAIDEDDNGSYISSIESSPYSFRGSLTGWGIDVAIAPAHNTAIYEFDFPASDDARINFDIARKLGSSTAMNNGSISIDLENGTISGGGTFDGNWNPAEYDVYFYAIVDATPTGAGTWVGDSASDGTLNASITSSQKLGGWLQFDTNSESTVRLKIAISFSSVEKAKAYLESEITDWDLAAVETAAKANWNETLAVVETPDISGAEARKIYTALYHSLIQPRDRTGDPTTWDADAEFWDDQYTIWDTWQTLYPLLSIIQPDTVASIVNSFAERYNYNGVAETAFIMGKDYQVGQGGDEVDRVIADALARDIDGIDWDGVWSLLEFNAARRTDNYLQLGYVPTDGDNEGYDFRMQSASSTLGFAHGDWAAAQVAESLGKTSEAAELLERSRNWRNVWDASANGAGFDGFVKAKDSSGNFDTSDVTSSSGFYQGTSWNYSFNIYHERDAMIELMGGQPRFIQRLNYAFSQNSSTYIDFTNEVNLQAAFLFGYAHRPYLSSYWVDSLRNAYTTYSYPGDEDSGAMASLYFFAASGIFPFATEDVYYLHGLRVPEMRFNLADEVTFTITAQNSSDENIFIQSASLNGNALNEAIIHHADITAGGSLDFVMGPYPNVWGTNGDFAAPDTTESEIEITLDGSWTLANGSATLSDSDSDTLVWGEGSDDADNSAIYNDFDTIELAQVGDTITLSAALELNGLTVAEGLAERFAWGLFYQSDENDELAWPGYLASNDASDEDGTMPMLRKQADESFYAADSGETVETYALIAPDFEDGTYQFILTLKLNEQYALDYYAALVRSSDGVLLAAYTGSDLNPTTLKFNRVGLRAGDDIDADSITISTALISQTTNDSSTESIELTTATNEDGEVSLSWSGISESAQTLTIRYRTTDGDWNILASGVDANATDYTAANLTAGVTYEFQVIEVDSDGIYSVYSNTDSIEAESTNADTTSILIETESNWFYLDDGSNQGTAWTETSYDTSTWSSGPAPLGYGDGDEATTISYGDDSDNKHPTSYFRHNFELSADEIATIGLLKLAVQRDDGMVVYLNGVEIARDNMDYESFDYQSYATGVVDGDNEDTYFEYYVEPDALLAGTNVIAVEVHQQRSNSSDVSFDLNLEAVTSADTTVITTGDTWSYDDSGSDYETEWKELDFDHDSWSAGLAQFGYGDGDENTELDYGTDSSNKHTTYYFRKNFEVSELSLVADLHFRLLRDDGAIVYINGVEVIRENMPEGDIDSSTYANNAISGDDESTYYDYYLAKNYLVSGSNVIAVEVHQSNATSSDVSFDLELTLEGEVDANTAVFTEEAITLTHSIATAAYSYDLSPYISNPDDDTIDYTILEGPTWLSIDSNGLLSGTPTTDDIGDASVVVVISDDDGASAITLELTTEEAFELDRAPLPGLDTDSAVRFGVIPDTQGSTSGVPVDEASAVATELINQAPDFVIHVGDVTDGNSSDGDTKLAELEYLKEVLVTPLAEAGIGFYPVRGNHDSNAYQNTSSDVSAWAAAFPYLFEGENPLVDPTDVPGGSEASPNYSNFCYVYSPNDNMFFVSVDQWNGGDDDTNYSNWVADKFAEIRSEYPDAHIFGYSHSGLFALALHPAMTEFVSTGADPYIAAGKEYEIDGWFSGHNHIYDRSMAVNLSDDNKPYMFDFTTGSASEKFYSLSRTPAEDQHLNCLVDSSSTDGSPIAYLLVNIVGPFVQIETYMSPDTDGSGTFDDWSVWDAYTYSRNGLQFTIAAEENYNDRNIADTAPATEDYFGTSVTIIDGINSDTTTYNAEDTDFTQYRNITTGWWTRDQWYAEEDRNIISDIVSIHGMRNDSEHNRSDTYTLTLSYDESLLSEDQINKLRLVAFLDEDTTDEDVGDWLDAASATLAVEINSEPLLRSPTADDKLGAWGIDIENQIVWARIDYQGDFAIACELTDSDKDGLADDWEQSQFGSLDYDANDDPDGDGLINLYEQATGSSPLLSDTDGDLIDDATEVNVGLDPTDPNNTITDSVISSIINDSAIQTEYGLYTAESFSALAGQSLMELDEDGKLNLHIELYQSSNLKDWDKIESSEVYTYPVESSSQNFFYWDLDAMTE